MDTSNTLPMLNEAGLPGNEAAFARLQAALQDEHVIAFTGSGISAPDIPTWSPLLHKLLREAVNSGLLNEEDFVFLQERIESEPLEVATNIEESFTRERFRAVLSGIFQKEGLCTENHESVMALRLSGIVTLNYDDGLSNAFVRRFNSVPHSSRSSDPYELARWSQGSLFNVSSPPILHWHGVPSSPENMIFTGDDYSRFYGVADNVSFLEDLWRSKRLLIVGFGFTDPFLTRVLDFALRHYQSDNRHFAIIGYKGGGRTAALFRRNFARKYRLEPIFYPIITSETGGEDHTALGAILKALCRTSSGGHTSHIEIINPSLPVPSVPSSTDDLAKAEFEKDLFVGQLQNPVYAEPRLYRPNAVINYDPGSSGEAVKVDQVVSSDRWIVITAPHEYGLSTLGRRFVLEFNSKGWEAHMRDAAALPEYQRKMERDDIFSPIKQSNRRVLILDGFDFSNHERLLKEIIGLNRFERLILLVKSTRRLHVADDIPFSDRFDTILLSNLERSDVRTLATQMYGTSDTDILSGAVEKTYKDLLDLCVPLTPSNVVMYLAIVYREGDFLPLNRLQVIDRYIRNLLQRPSDVYRETFNLENKLEVISNFVHAIHKAQFTSFDESDWESFCGNYMQKSLIDFDSRALLEDLLSSRILLRYGIKYIFKYRLFYSYFLGRFVANRPSELQKFVEGNSHIQVEGLVEVISGLSLDNTALITDLCNKLEFALAAFDKRFPMSNWDPYATMEWSYSPTEEEDTWVPIAKSLSQGPAKAEEIDTLKRSISAERRTDSQAVTIRDFNTLEKSVVYNQNALVMAVNNAIDISGELKVRAVKAIIGAYATAFRIGYLFAPIIASKRYFSWNDVGFENRFVYDDFSGTDATTKIAHVIWALPTAIVNKVTEEMGSRKLGEVYRYLAETGTLTGFEHFINSSLVFRSKPRQWQDTASGIIDKMDRRALYLRYLLLFVMRHYRVNINTSADRSNLKRLVAKIRAKRDLNKHMPGAKAVNAMLKRLEEIDYFDIV